MYDEKKVWRIKFGRNLNRMNLNRIWKKFGRKKIRILIKKDRCMVLIMLNSRSGMWG